MIDQRFKFVPRGLLAELVGEAQCEPLVLDSVREGKVQLLFISPESILSNPQWRDMLHTATYRDNLTGFVVDEAHCVKKCCGTTPTETAMAETMSTVMENGHSYQLGSRSISERALQKHHLKLRKELNVQILLPYLNRYHLITTDVYEELLLQTTNTTKVDRLVAELLRMGYNSLVDFIQSLRDSAEDEPGTSHGQIADDLEEELKHQAIPGLMSPQPSQQQVSQDDLAQLRQDLSQVQSLHAELLQRLPHQRINLKCHKTRRTRHQNSRLKWYLAYGRKKRPLAHGSHRDFKHNCSTNRSMESTSNLRMIENTPSYISGGDITGTPIIPFPTPSGDDMITPGYTSHQHHSTAETPHDVTDSLSPFPTPRREDDFIPPPKCHQMYPRKKEPMDGGGILKTFFIADIGRCDMNTIALVGRRLLGDSEYESVLSQEEPCQVKRIVNRIFEEWEKKGESEIELLNAFKAINCEELVDKLQVFFRRQTRLFSLD